MKTFLPLFMAVLIPTAILSQTFSYINNGNESENHHPFYGLYDYSHNMYIFDQSNFGEGEKEIYELQFELSSYGHNYTYSDLTIKLAHTSDDFFKSSTKVDLSNITYSDLTTCLSSHDLVILGEGYVSIPFTTTFNYNGVDNILIIVENHDGDWTMGFGAAKGSNTTSYKSWYKYSDNSYPSGTGTRQRYIPNIGLGYLTFNPLPIELMSFEGSLTDNKSIELKWTTASQSNNDYFTLWRSFDGHNWDAITNLNGSGSSTEEMNYSYFDSEAIHFNRELEQVYYKLSQTDYDGNSEEFTPISVTLNKSDRYLLRTVNLMGSEVSQTQKGLVLEIWSDGTSNKRYKN